ncbi:MAG: M48 family metallopeptidase [Magnetospirillum sp.]
MGVPGLYRDGKNARDHQIVVRLLGHGLDIIDHDGQVLAHWPKAQISRVDGTDDLRLACSSHPLARLLLPQPSPVSLWLPQRRSARGLWLGLVAGSAAMVALLAWGLPRLSIVVAHMVPLETERSWGQTFVAQMEDRKVVCADASGADALDRLEKRLATALPAEQRPTRVVVVNDPLVNAIALPGGTIIMFKGLLDQAESADEIAGVLAHEMAHVAQRHPLAAAIRSIGVASLATMMTGDFSALVATLGGMALSGHYSRTDESAADSMAVNILRDADISPLGLATFFDRLKQQGGELPEFLSSHPELESRRQRIVGLPRGAPTSSALDKVDFQHLKNICAQPARKLSTR